MNEPLSPTWRADLHRRLDTILDAREQLEEEDGVTPRNALMWTGVSYAHLSTSPVGEKAQALMKETAALAAEAIGEPLRCAAFQIPAAPGRGQRTALRHWLVLLESILRLPTPSLASAAPNQYLDESTVYLGLCALDVGEIWQIFQPGSRGNRPANSYSLSVARLAALEWKRRLISLGLSEGEANREITNAFGEQWDTIRKWRGSCAATLGETLVQATLDRADHDEKERMSWPEHGLLGMRRLTTSELLRNAGERYRAAKLMSAELSPAKQRAARRSEKQADHSSG